MANSPSSIQHTRPAPTPQPSTPAPAPRSPQNRDSSDKTTSQRTSSGNKSESRESLQQDASLFAQLLMPGIGLAGHGGEGGGQQNPQMEESSTSQGGAPMPPALAQMCQKISDQLPAQPAAFECSLLMPHIGEVQVKAEPQMDSWKVGLVFQQPQGLDIAKRSRKRLNEQLTDSFGRPVSLTLALRGETMDD